jgi:hypothetical protein
MSGTRGLAGHRGDGREIGDAAARIGDRFDEDRLGLGRQRRLEALRLLGVGPHHMPAEGLERVVELVDRAAVELARGDELVAGPHQRVEGDELGGMA